MIKNVKDNKTKKIINNNHFWTLEIDQRSKQLGEYLFMTKS